MIDEETIKDERQWENVRTPEAFLGSFGSSMEQALLGKTTCLVINKVDKVHDKAKLSAFVSAVQMAQDSGAGSDSKNGFAAVFPVCALDPRTLINIKVTTIASPPRTAKETETETDRATDRDRQRGQERVSVRV